MGCRVGWLGRAVSGTRSRSRAPPRGGSWTRTESRTHSISISPFCFRFYCSLNVVVVVSLFSNPCLPSAFSTFAVCPREYPITEVC